MGSDSAKVKILLLLQLLHMYIDNLIYRENMYWRITCQDRKEQFKLLILKVLSKLNQHIIVKLIEPEPSLKHPLNFPEPGINPTASWANSIQPAGPTLHSDGPTP